MLTDLGSKVVQIVPDLGIESNSRSVPAPESRSMYAITFDLDQKELAQAYPGDSHKYAYEAIGNFLKKRGFTWQQGSVYFGDETMDPVKAVLAVQELARTYDWFNSRVVRDIRMLRIEENNDLNPAIRYVQQNKPPLTLDYFGTGTEGV